MGTLRIISESGKPFRDRGEAGRLLAAAVGSMDPERTVVCGIPRGGVIIAREIAERLGAPMDVVLTHKLAAPYNPELAIGAVSEDGTLFVNQPVADAVGADDSYIEQEKGYQLREIRRKVALYRPLLPKIALKDKMVIVTDDGVATGATMQAALWAIRRESPRRRILALPVGPRDSVTRLAEDADETVCLRVPPFFDALGRFYRYFGQIEDKELMDLLKQEQAGSRGV
jgi:putative phosphoribosyl transferase